MPKLTAFLPLLPRFLAPALVFACVLASGSSEASEPVALAVLLSERSPAHLEVTEALRVELGGGGGGTELIVATDLANLPRPPTRLLITVGTSAFLAAVNSDIKTPILATLLPRAAFDRIAEQADRAGRRSARTLSAVVLDQPVTRQLDLIRVALPDVRRVGVVLGAESQGLAAALADATAERGMHLETSRAGGTEDIFHALQRLLGASDVLLAEPDPAIYNSTTIQNILLTTYRAQMPLIGFAPSYVKAGALLALYTTPAQMGAQVGELARGVLAGKALPSPQSPRDFSIATNPHVARSLGLQIEEVDVLLERLRQLERRP